MRTLVFFIVTLTVSFMGLCADNKAVKPFFRASHEQPYHLSVGAVLFDQEGRVACHHFNEIYGYKDIYILMRESVEDGESPLTTLQRGLQEEFGATAQPVAFLGSLVGPLSDTKLSFEKTTLYIACQLIEWHPERRDTHDSEAISTIQWHKPDVLIDIMQKQGIRFQDRVDADESEMIKRALPWIKANSSKN